MPARVSRRLVIDASVARSAGGEEATFPTSKHCRDFFKATLAVCHCVVMTPQISEEWRQHWSNFARRWLVSMMARKKVHLLGNVVNEDLRGRIELAAAQAKDPERAEMRKDLLLIEAAIATDRTVISLDDTARGLFTIIARSVGELRSVAWVNPDKAEEQPILWLENGAKPEKRRLLGSRTGDELISFINNDEAVRPDGTRGPGLFAYLRGLQGADGGDRRDVVGQMLDYAANAVMYWPIETIRSKFEAACEKRGEDPAQFLQQGRQKVHFFAVWTTASVEIYFQYLQAKPPFDAEDKRRELLDRLNKIPGFDLPSDSIVRRPVRPISLLCNAEALKQFQETIEWGLGVVALTSSVR